MTYLIDVGALDLRHSDEVVSEQQTVVLANPAHLRQTLVAVEEKLFAESFQLLRVLRQHEAEGFLFVVEEFVLAPD